MMKSLLQLTLDYVGHHQKIFTLHSITALPYPIQEKFLVYLNAHDLYILSEKQPNHLSDKTLDHVWNLHVQRRWTRAQIVMNIFHDTGLNGNPKLVYLQKYFLEILSYCSINLNTVDPISLFHCPLHKMNRPWPSDSTPNDHNDLTLHIQDLMKFSKYAETLTIIGSQCSWIYVNQDLLNALRSVTKIIQIQTVNDTYFESIIGLLQTLINHGKVTHAVFSMVNLTCQNLSYLMQICAGIHIHSKDSNDSLTLHDQELQCKRLKTDMNSQYMEENNEPIPSTSFDEEMLASVPYPSSSCNHCQDQYCLDLEVESQELFPVDTSLDHDEPQVKDQGDEIDLFDEAVTPLPSKDPVVVRQIVNADGSHICLKGLTTFALLNTNSHYKENFGRVLVDVLPHWKSLTKFAIFDIDSESEDLMNGIVKKLEDHQLTHLVIDDANLNQTFFERLLCTFKDHYKISEDEETVHKALELLDFQACLKSLTAENVVHFEGQIKGIYKLDLSMTTILDSGFTLLLELVRNDTALRHLKLNGCFLREDQVLQLLSVLSVTEQLETLGLSGNRVREQDVETELIKFINSNKQLKTLILNYSRLSCQFVDSEMFTMAVTTHPSLRELSIKSNHLKETSCRLLKKICCSMEPCSLRSLNIGYNWVKGAELVAVAKDITQFRESHDLCEQALDFLCLSGNRLYLSDSSQSKVWMMFNGLVKDLECDRIDYERPFEEHIAQM